LLVGINMSCDFHQTRAFHMVTKNNNESLQNNNNNISDDNLPIIDGLWNVWKQQKKMFTPLKNVLNARSRHSLMSLQFMRKLSSSSRQIEVAKQREWCLMKHRKSFLLLISRRCYNSNSTLTWFQTLTHHAAAAGCCYCGSGRELLNVYSHFITSFGPLT